MYYRSKLKDALYFTLSHFLIKMYGYFCHSRVASPVSSSVGGKENIAIKYDKVVTDFLQFSEVKRINRTSHKSFSLSTVLLPHTFFKQAIQHMLMFSPIFMSLCGAVFSFLFFLFSS